MTIPTTPEGKGEASSHIPNQVMSCPPRLGNQKHWMPVCCNMLYTYCISRSLPFQNKCLARRLIYSRLRWWWFHHAVLWCSVHSAILCISYHEIQLWLCRYLAEGWKTIFWSLPRIYFISDKVSEYRISCLTQFSRWSSLVIKCMNLSLITFLVKITTGRSADSAAKNV